jgi:hypothetical protein
MGSGKHLLRFFSGELMYLDVPNVVIIPLKSPNGHVLIVAGCIYNSLQALFFNGQLERAGKFVAPET